MQYLIIGTAGHIDHGKTRLVQALTGTNADRLKEEQQRGITIDLGFAHTRIGGFQIGFIDVPGHERFVKNMLAGIAGIQLVLLVVAADESIMPQTREHFEICRLLGIGDGVVVLTKSDLVDSELIDLVKSELIELLEGTFLEKAAVAAVDSHTGRGIEDLRTLLEKKLAAYDPQPHLASQYMFRLPVDRVFSLKGFGTVVTGTAWQGTVRPAEIVQAYPSGLQGRIRNLQVYGNDAEAAQVGQRTALNLTGLNKDQLQRGMVLGPPGVFRPASVLDVSLELLASAPAPLQHRTPVRFHHGSAEVIGRVYPMASRVIGPGETGLLQLRLEAPVTACAGDRFIIRRYSPLMTIGGGIILDPRARKRRTAELEKVSPALKDLQKVWIERHQDRLSKSIQYYVRGEGFRGASLGELQARTGLTRSALRELLQMASGLVFFETVDLLVSENAVSGLEDRIVGYVQQFHSENPLTEGVPREELKEHFMSWASNGYFGAVLHNLQRTSRVRASAHTVSDYNHRVALTPPQEQLRKSILKVLDTDGHAALRVEELAALLNQQVNDLNDVFFFLIQQGKISRISENLFMSSNQVELWKTRLLQAYSPGNSFSVTDFKALFGLTRKLAIPFLEYLDRHRLTRRVGDRRIVL